MNRPNVFRTTRDDTVTAIFSGRGAPDDEGHVSRSVRRAGRRGAGKEDIIATEDILKALKRGAGILLASVVFALAAAWIYAEVIVTPSYRATSVIVLDPSGDQVVDFVRSSDLATDTVGINTQAAILRGRDLISSVVVEQDLLSDVEFNPAAVPDGPDLTPTEQQDIATRRLLSALQVRPVPTSLILEVRVETSEPAKSARLADAIAAAYVQSQLDQKISATLNDRNWLTQRMADLQSKLEVAETAVQDFRFTDNGATRAQEVVQFEQLKADVATLQELSQSFQSRLRETSIQEGLHTADSRILSRAVAPRSPSSPNTMLIYAAAGVLGLMLGLLILMVREARRDTFLDVYELERTVGLPVIGEIPKNGAGRSLFASRRTKETYENSIDVLRANIAFNGGDVLPAAIMVSSAVPGEGKSPTVKALAESAARSGNSVLVIDADLQRRVLSQAHGSRAPGHLEDVIAGTLDVSEAVMPLGRSGAHILCNRAGKGLSSFETLSSERFSAMVEDLVSRYRYVLIDVPPVLVSPDAQAVAQVADRVFLVARWGKTAGADVREAVAKLELSAFCPMDLALSFVPRRTLSRKAFQPYYAAARKQQTG